MLLDFITLTDGYKLDHRRQYPKGTKRVYANFTPRSSRIAGVDKVVFFGLQFFLQYFLMEHAQRTFFSQPMNKVLNRYKRLCDGYLGLNDIGTDHIAALHALGYIPLRYYAVPEGTHVPLRMPMFTYENTLDEFFWVTNYFETLESSVIWLPCTSATTAYQYRQLLNKYAMKTGDLGFVNYQGHDFSFRGMEYPDAAALSGMGHLLSFMGTDALPALQWIEDYYEHDGMAGVSVAATEHAVMCAGGKENEVDTFNRLLDLYPAGILSVVSDTWDLWNVIVNILPLLKDKIMGRNGKLVIRPDSGNPVDILCGDPTNHYNDAAGVGVIELLWNIFGGTINDKGYKVLDPHVGAIYGDSITLDRAQQICQRLEGKGFASTNVVLGIGSYTYQYVTRDTYGFAIKATWNRINDEENMMFKDPVTDSGVKKSARGRITLVDRSNGIEMIDGETEAQEKRAATVNLLQPVWENGHFLKRNHWKDMVKRVALG